MYLTFHGLEFYAAPAASNSRKTPYPPARRDREARPMNRQMLPRVLREPESWKKSYSIYQDSLDSHEKYNSNFLSDEERAYWIFASVSLTRKHINWFCEDDEDIPVLRNGLMRYEPFEKSLWATFGSSQRSESWDLLQCTVRQKSAIPSKLSNTQNVKGLKSG